MSELKCSQEMVQEWQDGITKAKTEFGPGSDEHCKAVEWAEAQGPALVADYLTLADENERLREALQGLMYFADRVLYSFNGDLSRHQRWEEAREAARLALNGQK